MRIHLFDVCFTIVLCIVCLLCTFLSSACFQQCLLLIVLCMFSAMFVAHCIVYVFRSVILAYLFCCSHYCFVHTSCCVYGSVSQFCCVHVMLIIYSVMHIWHIL